MIISANAHRRRIEETAATLGVALPTGFTKALTTAAKLIADTAEFNGVTRALNERAVSLLLSGKPVETDDTIKKLCVRRTLSESGLRVAGERTGNDMINTAIAEFADDVLTGWADALAPDLDVMQRAAEVIVADDLNRVDTAKVQRDGHLGFYGAALAADANVAAAVTGLKAIIAATGFPHRREHLSLAMADASLDQVDAINAATRGSVPAPWTVARVARFGADAYRIPVADRGFRPGLGSSATRARRGRYDARF
jgi:hypothetical protein